MGGTAGSECVLACRAASSCCFQSKAKLSNISVLYKSRLGQKVETLLMPLRGDRAEEPVCALGSQQARASAHGLSLAHADGQRLLVGGLKRSCRCCGDSWGTHAKKTAAAV